MKLTKHHPLKARHFLQRVERLTEPERNSLLAALILKARAAGTLHEIRTLLEDRESEIAKNEVSVP